MATQDPIIALKNFYNTFTQTNQSIIGKENVSSDALYTTMNNNIDALNTLLTAFMGTAEQQNVAKAINSTTSKAQTQKQTSIAANTQAATPTYNVRTPYVQLALNGAIVDFTTPVDTTATSASTIAFDGVTPSNVLYKLGIEVLFSDLELTMPFGGAQSTIRGNLKLYSRTPIELLGFLTNGLADESSSDDDSTSGLPTCDLIIGWNTTDGTGSLIQLKSPALPFLITNVQMSDPGKTMGSEFTLTLQDAGSACLQNSSANLGILPDYPQEQLRFIIEKCLGFRLFTLDDLLLLGNNTTNAATLQLDTTKAAQFKNDTFFINSKAAPLRINANTLENVCSELLNYISCRWYPVDNKNLETAIGDASVAESQIQQFRQQVQTGELSIQQGQEKFNEEQTKLASTCILVWCPFFPANIKTTSDSYYIKGDTETGAFLLLPKVIENNGLMSSNLSIIYGPGGSGIPYFYGGAENVFQQLASLNSSYSAKGFSNTVGEVLDLSLNFSNYIAVMKNNYNEEVLSRENGKFLMTKSISKVANDTLSRAAKTAAQQKYLLNKLRTMHLLDPNGKPLSPEEVLKRYKTIFSKTFTLQGDRLKRSVAQRKIFHGDSDSILSGDAGNRSYPNPQPVTQFALSKLQSRVGTFLNYPLTIGMTVLGDPYLLRQGIGAFELINYYPTLDGKDFKFNAIVSGVYVPQTIIHRISLGDYTTEIRALKVPNLVENTAIESYSLVASHADNSSDTQTVQYQQILNQLMQVNLETLAVSKNPPVNAKDEQNLLQFASVNSTNQGDLLTNVVLTGELANQMKAAFTVFNTINQALVDKNK